MARQAQLVELAVPVALMAPVVVVVVPVLRLVATEAQAALVL